MTADERAGGRAANGGVDRDTQLLLRCLLFAPASEPRKLARLTDFGADAVAMDLEDAVPEGRKVAAREHARHAVVAHAGRAVVTVRVNALNTAWAAGDIAAVVGPGLDCVVLPKVEDREALRAADEAIGRAELATGLPVGSVRVIALLETARAIASAADVLADPPRRLLTTALGAADLAADLGLDPLDRSPPVEHALVELVLATRAAGLARPLDGAHPDLADEAGLRRTSAHGRRLGCQGRIVIAPRQVGPVQAAYSDVSAEQAARAERVVAAFAAAHEQGSGAITVDGRFVDEPIHRAALHTLRLRDAHRPAAPE